MTDEELKQFKASISITDVAQKLGIVVERGRFRCFCGNRHVHGDRTPSVSISEERGYFRCWVCDDVRGDVISLVEQYRGVSFLEALDWLQETYPFLLPSRLRRNDVRSIESVANPSAKAKSIQEIVQSRKEEKSSIPEEERKKIILSFLKMLSPVDGTASAAWLARRRIFKPVWDKMLLRTIVDYDALNRRLMETYSLDVLKEVGLFNDKGNLRYYKHPLIFPYLDSKMRASYFQARSLDRNVVPKELNLKGTVPFPYNVSALNKKAGWVYLCEGAIDTLTFLMQKIEAIGIPGVRSFKVEWIPLFENKNVVLCLDKDEAGRSGTEYLQTLFSNAHIRTAVLGSGTENLSYSMKEGEDINEWFGGKK